MMLRHFYYYFFFHIAQMNFTKQAANKNLQN